jgi:hypothetical protein
MHLGRALVPADYQEVFESRHLQPLNLETGLIAKNRIKKCVEPSRLSRTIVHDMTIGPQGYVADIRLNCAKIGATVSIGIGHLKHIGRCWITRAF